MKAVIHDRYGAPDVLRIGERPLPEPGPGEIRVAVHASTVTSGDARMRRADPFPVRLFFGWLRPKKQVPGYEFAGTVEATGDGAGRFEVGDRVFGAAGFGFGALAEFLTVPEDGTLTRIPEGWSFTEAAAIPFGATTARYFLEDKGRIRSGERVLVHGASGAVGVAALQIARLFGAAVDGVCGPAHVELIRSLGAERAVDYTRETPGPASYDLIFDAAGKLEFALSKAWLRKGGRLVSVRRGLAKERAEDYPLIAGWMAEGKLRPVIDQVYPLEEIVAAHRKVDSGHKTGSVVISLRED